MLVIQKPKPSPGVYWPISSNGRDNFGYQINGPSWRQDETYLAGCDGGCGGGGGWSDSLWAALIFAGLGTLGYSVGAALKK